MRQLRLDRRLKDDHSLHITNLGRDELTFSLTSSGSLRPAAHFGCFWPIAKLIGSKEGNKYQTLTDVYVVQRCPSPEEVVLNDQKFSCTGRPKWLTEIGENTCMGAVARLAAVASRRQPEKPAKLISWGAGNLGPIILTAGFLSQTESQSWLDGE